jgi:hypothetical protein
LPQARIEDAPLALKETANLLAPGELNVNHRICRE